jgi:hypothetical protein
MAIEFYGLVAAAEGGGPTAAMDLIQGKDKLMRRASDLIESGHTVRIFKCVPLEFEAVSSVTIYITDE